MAAWKARGSGEAGPNPRVRPVPGTELARISVESTGEVSRGGARPKETAERPRCT